VSDSEKPLVVFLDCFGVGQVELGCDAREEPGILWRKVVGVGSSFYIRDCRVSGKG